MDFIIYNQSTNHLYSIFDFLEVDVIYDFLQNSNGNKGLLKIDYSNLIYTSTPTINSNVGYYDIITTQIGTIDTAHVSFNPCFQIKESNGIIHVSWYESSTKEIKYTYREDGVWSTPLAICNEPNIYGVITTTSNNPFYSMNIHNDTVYFFYKHTSNHNYIKYVYGSRDSWDYYFFYLPFNINRFRIATIPSTNGFYIALQTEANKVWFLDFTIPQFGLVYTPVKWVYTDKWYKLPNWQYYNGTDFEYPKRTVFYDGTSWYG